MIIFNIIQDDETMALEMSDFLIEYKFAIQTSIDTNTYIEKGEKKSSIRLFFITKALLYSSIENEINIKYPNNNLLIYATPVSHINHAFGELLRIRLKAI